MRAQAINEKHREVVALGRTAKEIAAEIGEELLAVKAELKHGEFIPWVEQNCAFAYRGAAEYMQVARTKNAERRTFDACSSIREVLAIGKTKAAPKPDTRAATLDDLRKVERLRALRDNPAATEGPAGYLKGFRDLEVDRTRLRCSKSLQLLRHLRLRRP